MPRLRRTLVHLARVGKRSTVPLLPPSLYSSTSRSISSPLHSLNPAAGAGGLGAARRGATDADTLTPLLGGGGGGDMLGGLGIFMPPKLSDFAERVNVTRKLKARYGSTRLVADVLMPLSPPGCPAPVPGERRQTR